MTPHQEAEDYQQSKNGHFANKLGAGQSIQAVTNQPGQSTHNCGSRQSNQPSNHHAASNRPANLSTLTAQATTQNRTGCHVSGGQCHAEVRRGQNNRSGRTVSSNTLRGIHLNNALTESADNAPATQVSTQSNSNSTGCLHPQGDRIVIVQSARSNQSKEDHTHGLLRIVGTVRQGHQGCGRNLSLTEATVLTVVSNRSSNTVNQPSAGCRHNSRNDGGKDRGNNNLGQNTHPLHAVKADSDNSRTNQATEQSVRRGRGKTQKPGQNVPEDAANQAGKDNEHQRRTVRCHIDTVQIHDTATDRACHLNGEERTHKVQGRRQRHGGLRLQRTGCNGGCHRVTGVVEAIRKVEGERGKHHDHENNEFCSHKKIICRFSRNLKYSELTRNNR